MKKKTALFYVHFPTNTVVGLFLHYVASGLNKRLVI